MAEKALKALSLKFGRESRAHSCVQVEKMLRSAGLDTASITAAYRKLDGHYIMSRCPNGVGGPPADSYGEETVKELEECRERIAGFVRERI